MFIVSQSNSQSSPRSPASPPSFTHHPGIAFELLFDAPSCAPRKIFQHSASQGSNSCCENNLSQKSTSQPLAQSQPELPAKREPINFLIPPCSKKPDGSQPLHARGTPRRSSPNTSPHTDIKVHQFTTPNAQRLSLSPSPRLPPPRVRLEALNHRSPILSAPASQAQIRGATLHPTQMRPPTGPDGSGAIGDFPLAHVSPACSSASRLIGALREMKPRMFLEGRYEPALGFCDLLVEDPAHRSDAVHVFFSEFLRAQPPPPPFPRWRVFLPNFRATKLPSAKVLVLLCVLDEPLAPRVEIADANFSACNVSNAITAALRYTSHFHAPFKPSQALLRKETWDFGTRVRTFAYESGFKFLACPSPECALLCLSGVCRPPI
eukprot:gnl/Chilomastix_cuspidata/1399.p1 GENE.gnl/Chilomastix_cuspidata/1399~~gnl/Chilomastix_cuspidata/1399.p1  ORF type:complete len:378 (-),score=105.80 gnl/Chilomastix_cuspidata/1399:498-1631(-)